MPQDPLGNEITDPMELIKLWGLEQAKGKGPIEPVIDVMSQHFLTPMERLDSFLYDMMPGDNLEKQSRSEFLMRPLRRFGIEWLADEQYKGGKDLINNVQSSLRQGKVTDELLTDIGTRAATSTPMGKLAGATGAAGSKLLSILLGGPGAKTANKSMFDLAQDMQQSGVAGDVINKETGWRPDLAGVPWSFDIPTKNMRLKPDAIREIASLKGKPLTMEGMGSFLDYPELAEAYPELWKNTNTEFFPISNGYLGYASPAFMGRMEGGLDVNSMGFDADLLNWPPNLKGTMAHEIQHIIAPEERWMLGSNPSPTMWEHLPDFEEALYNIEKLGGNRENFMEDVANDFYNRTGGEASSSLVGSRTAAELISPNLVDPNIYNQPFRGKDAIKKKGLVEFLFPQSAWTEDSYGPKPIEYFMGKE